MPTLADHDPTTGVEASTSAMSLIPGITGSDIPTNHECKTNEVWNSCGTTCPARCFRPAPTICNKMCKIGCACKKGYLLNSSGDCVNTLGCLLDLWPSIAGEKSADIANTEEDQGCPVGHVNMGRNSDGTSNCHKFDPKSERNY
ncbi:unnamed protein product [Clonostachys rosea]|uniref:TIL domain-containing protein n=1 Tax=Bionectria ochroleuca TaxID=29856 RepID=A0ABY6TZI1_BIOOC|nr:unnamed protein product [Clonostachys rosea]